MKAADFLPKLAMFATAYPTTRLVVTDGCDDVYEGNFDPAGVANALNPRENVVSVRARNAFFTLHFVKGLLVDCWRSSDGEWIGDELGLKGRDVFGHLPATTPVPTEKRERHKVEPEKPFWAEPQRDPNNPFAPTETAMARAARTGNLAEALNGEKA